MRKSRVWIATLVAALALAVAPMAAAAAGPAPHSVPQSSQPDRAAVKLADSGIKLVDPRGGTPRSGATPNTYYFDNYFTLDLSGQVMAVAAAGGSKTRVIQWEWLQHPSQLWDLETVSENPGMYYLHPSYNHGLCLDDPYGSTTNGTYLWVYTCNGTPSQRFGFDTAGRDGHDEIRPYWNAYKCLDVHTPNEGDRVQLWDCNGSSNQSWIWNWL